MLRATYSRKYVEAIDRLFDEFRQRTAAIAESVGMKIYYLVPLHPLEREKPRFTHRLAYRATEVASLDSSQLQLFSEGWCRAGVFAPNGSSLFAVRMIAYFGCYRPNRFGSKLLSLQNYISGRI